MNKNLPNSGYSGTPLGKKLGYKPNFRCFLCNPPDGYSSLIEPIPEGVVFLKTPSAHMDLVHLFSKSFVELNEWCISLRPLLAETGMIWASWPKKAAKISTDITEDRIRDIAFSMDLVDVKVCAVDSVWSALKLVIRVSARKSK